MSGVECKGRRKEGSSTRPQRYAEMAQSAKTSAERARRVKTMVNISPKKIQAKNRLKNGLYGGRRS